MGGRQEYERGMNQHTSSDSLRYNLKCLHLSPGPVNTDKTYSIITLYYIIKNLLCHLQTLHLDGLSIGMYHNVDSLSIVCNDITDVMQSFE